MRKLALAFIIYFVFFTFSAGFSHAGLEFEGRYWMPRLDGKVDVSRSGLSDKIDVKSDLDLSDENFPEGRLALTTGPRSRIRFAYTQASYSGDNMLQRTIEFSGKTYTAGTRVVTDLDVRYFRLGWIWEFIDVLEGFFRAGTILEAKGINAKVSLDAPSLNINESHDFWGGLPTVGFAFGVGPEKINVFGEFSGLGAGGLGYFFDAEAGVRVNIINNFSLIAGYRMILLNAEKKPDFARLQLNGPFLGGIVNF